MITFGLPRDISLIVTGSVIRIPSNTRPRSV